MIRKIIKIDERKCNGCGACAAACHEGAIDMVDGKARLTREDYCDGLGDCLPACPTNAITFEVREAPCPRCKAERQPRRSPMWLSWLTVQSPDTKHSVPFCRSVSSHQSTRPVAGTDQTRTCQRPLF